MQKSIRSPKVKVLTLLVLIAALYVVVPAVYAHEISPVGSLTITQGDTFNINVAGDCVVRSTVQVANSSIVSGGGTKTDEFPVFPMTGIGAGTTKITISFKGQGVPPSCDDEGTKMLTVEVLPNPDFQPTPLPGSSASCGSCGTELEPINTFNGELFNLFSAAINLGGPMPLLLQLYYASYLRKNFIVGDLGNNWRHNFDASLSVSGNMAKYVTHKGRVTDFRRSSASGPWVQQTNLDTPYQLSATAGQDASLFDPEDRRIYTFDFTTSNVILGKLVRVEDGGGSLHTVSYHLATGNIDSVSDGLGRTLTFTYNDDAIPKISMVTADTRSVMFQYADPLNPENLTGVTDVRGGQTTFAYKDSSGTADHALMLSNTRPLQNVPFTQIFYAAGQVRTQTDADGNTTRLSYRASTRTTTLTDPLGEVRVHTARPTGEFSAFRDQAGKSFFLSYNSSGQLGSVTDRLGDTTTYRQHAPSGELSGVTDADGNSRSFTYTARAVGALTLYDLSGIGYADGTTESLVYDGFGDLISRTDQRGNTETYTYNIRGQLLTAENKLGGVSSNTYNADATPNNTTDPAGNTTSFGYDGLRRLNSVSHADGSERSLTFDAADDLLTTTDENGNTTTFTYDANGNLVTVSDPLLNTATFVYDGNDRPINSIDPLGGVDSISYDPLGRIGTTTDANGNVVTSGYNALGRLTSITDPLGHVWPRSYDAEGIITSSADPLGNTTLFASDSMGRVIQTTSPMGNINRLSYDALGRVATLTDALDQVTTFSRDARGQISSVSLPGSTISSAYVRNAAGDIIEVIDPNGNAWHRDYDQSGRLTSRSDPLGQAETTSFDSRNRASLVTFPGGLGKLTPTYDNVGNLTSLDYTDGTALGFSYDANHRLTTANNGGATPNNVTRTYDANGLISSSNGIAIGRDAGGRITSMTLAPGKTVTYTYDANDRLTSITDWTEGATNFSYDKADERTGITRPNDVNTAYTRDGDGRLTGIVESGVSSIALSYDGNGQITEATRSVPTATMVAGLANTARTFDAASQIIGYSYDALGRRTEAGRDTFTWDLASRLVNYTAGGVIAANNYDALGRRTSRTVGAVIHSYIWNDGLGFLPSISVEVRGSGDFRYFVHTPEGKLLYSIDAAGNARSFYHFDEMGNTIFVTDDAGGVIGSYAYTPYGELTASSGGLDNPFTWQGLFGVMDERNGLYYVRARFYDSASGRFISRDAIASIDPQEINPYQYALDNPLRFVDPRGLDPGDITGGEAIVGKGKRRKVVIVLDPKKTKKKGEPPGLDKKQQAVLQEALKRSGAAGKKSPQIVSGKTKYAKVPLKDYMENYGKIKEEIFSVNNKTKKEKDKLSEDEIQSILDRLPVLRYMFNSPEGEFTQIVIFPDGQGEEFKGLQKFRFRPGLLIEDPPPAGSYREADKKHFVSLPE